MKFFFFHKNKYQLSFQKKWLKCSEECPLMKYHTNKDLVKDISNIYKQSSNQSVDLEVKSLGKSMKDRDLWAFRIRKQNRNETVDGLNPMVKLIGNMHGNEPTGRELLIHLIKYIIWARETLDKNQGTLKDNDTLLQRAAKILETTDLWIVPSMNPDG